MSAWLTPWPSPSPGWPSSSSSSTPSGHGAGRGGGSRAGWSPPPAASLIERVSGPADDAADGDPGWIVLLWTVAAVGLGRLGAGWQERVRRTAQVVAELERGRGAATRMATAHERQVLASELHDTVAHAMTVVCLQAAAQRRAGGDAGPALRTIAATAAGSLAELREGLDAIETAPRPLEQSRLIGRRPPGRRRGGRDGAGPGPVRLGGRAGLRVVREALVNVARHAPGATGGGQRLAGRRRPAGGGPRPRQHVARRSCPGPAPASPAGAGRRDRGRHAALGRRGPAAASSSPPRSPRTTDDDRPAG